MGVDLCVIAHAARANAEALHRPAEIVLPIPMPKRQTFTKSCFIDLDHLRACRLEIIDLITDGQRDLPACQASGDIVAHERPVEDRYRTGQHALDGFISE